MKLRAFLTKSTPLISLYTMARQGNISPAYMFVCEDEMLLDEAVATFIAQRIIKSGQDIEKVVDKILRGGYADIKFFPEGDTVKVDDVKKLLQDVYYTPMELDVKFYVINNAETANDAAQNKLLKTLEDVSSSTCIILKCKKVEKILPTIKSRCQRIEIPPYSYEELSEELARNYVEDESFNFALSVSGGYPGIAIKAMEDKSKYAMFQLARETLLFMKTSKDMLHYSAKWLAQKNSVREILDNVERFMSDLVLLDACQGSLIKLKSNTKDLITLKSMGYTGEVALKILPRIAESKQKLDFNASVVTIIDAILYSILEVKAKCRK